MRTTSSTTVTISTNEIGAAAASEGRNAASAPVVAVEQFERDTGRQIQKITRLTWRGWAVHVIDGVAVTVPTQPTENKSTADLAACLRAAYVRVPVGDRCSGPTTGSRRIRQAGPLANAVADVINAAVPIARRWHSRGHCDLHICLKRAWNQTGRRAPYCAVLAAVREALEANTTLVDFTDTVDAEAKCELLRRAARLTPGQPCPVDAAKTA